MDYLTSTKLFTVSPQRASFSYSDYTVPGTQLASVHPQTPQHKAKDAPPGLELLRPKVILREFFASKYEYPSMALGARMEFKPVSEVERDSGNRPLMINFLGSIKPGIEIDRERLQSVLETHRWRVPTKFKIFNSLVRNPNTTTKDDYRVTLLSSSFTLAPVGTADDCFRFWEAIEAGSIPIFVRRMQSPQNKHNCPDAFEDVLAANPPIVLLESWDDLPDYIGRIREEDIARLRREMVVWSREWWTNSTKQIDAAISHAIKAKEAGQAVQTAESLLLHESQAADALEYVNVKRKQARKDKNKNKNQKAAAAQINSHDGGDGESLFDYNANIAQYTALEDHLLKTTVFSFFYDVVHKMLASHGYLDGFFSSQEMDRLSPYMQFSLNKASFIDKLIKAVADDLDFLPEIVTLMNVDDGDANERVRLLLCLINLAARKHAAAAKVLL